MYRYFLTEIASGIGPGQLTLDAGHRFLNNGSNSYLARGGGSFVWRDTFQSGNIELIDTGTGDVTIVGTTDGSLGNLDAVGETLVAVATQFGPTTTSHVFAVVPEPSTALVILGCLGVLGLSRQR
jgi:hypothetical protein